MLAVDIGGTNIRAGIVLTQLAKASDLSAGKVWKCELWRHVNDSPSRDEAVARLDKMLQKLIDAAKRRKAATRAGDRHRLSRRDRGRRHDRPRRAKPAGRQLGRREDSTCRRDLIEAIPTIGDHETHVIMHNDAVVQGLSQVPFMTDVEHWGVLTIGTGLGNARFTNIAARDGKKDDKDNKDKAKNDKANGDKAKKKKKDKDKEKEKEKV